MLTEEPARSGDSTEPSETLADQEMVRRCAPMVRRIAMKTVRRVPADITIDDLIGVGWVGLTEALRRRGSCKNEEQFEAYASHRIRGAILDYLRSLDPMSRRMRGASRSVTLAIKQLSARLGRAPHENEIADELGLELSSYQDLLSQIAQSSPAHVDVTELTSAHSSSDVTPDSLLSRREMIDCLAAAIQQLPERLQLVLNLHYQEECSLKEIGAVLNVTESRACQLHTEAIHRIRAELDRIFEDDESGRVRMGGEKP